MSSSPEVSQRVGAGSELRVDLWLDLTCPWCYLGTHRLAKAIDAACAEAAVGFVLRSFELNPGMSTEPVTVMEYLAAKFAGTIERAREMDSQVAALAQAENLPYTSDRPLANTFDVHRVLHLARGHGVANELFLNMQRRYFGGELNPFDPAALVETAAAAGIPADETSAMLAGDAYADSVRRELAKGRALGITGVPFAVFGDEYAVSGAQSTEVFAAAIQTALDTQAQK